MTILVLLDVDLLINARLNSPYPAKVVPMESVVTLPTRLDCDVVTPDGQELAKVRIAYLANGRLQGIRAGTIVVGPTTIVGEVVQDGKVYRVPTPEGVFVFTKRARACCGG